MSYQQEVYAIFVIVANVYLARSLPRGMAAACGVVWLLLAIAISGGWIPIK